MTGEPVELPSTRTVVARVGDVVVRSTGPWSATVRTILRHLEHAGFASAPRVVLDGVDDDAREHLSFVHGHVRYPDAWSDEGLAELGRLLRRFHDATAGYVAPADAVWQPWSLRSDRRDAPIGHGDLGPWNIVVRDGMPVAFIDWELAGPMEHLDEVAQVAWLNVELFADVADRLPSVAPEALARRLRLLVDGYGLGAPARREVVDRMVGLAARDASTESERHGGLKIAKAPAGLDRESAADWRRRSAEWLAEHRDLLVRALDEQRRPEGDADR